MGLRDAILLLSVFWVLVAPGSGRPADSAPRIPETQADNPNVRRIFAYPEPKDIFNRLQKGSKLGEKHLKKGKESYKSKGGSTRSENELQETVHEGDPTLKDLNSRPLNEKATKESLSPKPQQGVDEAPQSSPLQKEPIDTNEAPNTDSKDDETPDEVTTIDPPSLLIPEDEQNEELEVDKDILVLEEPLTKITPGIVLSVITPVEVVAAEEVQEEPQTSEERVDEISTSMVSKPSISDVAPENPQPMVVIPLDDKPIKTQTASVAVGLNDVTLIQKIATQTLFPLQEGEEDPHTAVPEMSNSHNIDTTTAALEVDLTFKGEVVGTTTTDTVPLTSERSPELVAQIGEAISDSTTETPVETEETATPGFSQEVTPEVNSEATQAHTPEETPDGTLEANPEDDEDNSAITQEIPTATEEVPRKVTLGEVRSTSLDIPQEESSGEIPVEEDLASTTVLPQPMVDPIELMFKDEPEPEADLILNDTFI